MGVDALRRQPRSRRECSDPGGQNCRAIVRGAALTGAANAARVPLAPELTITAMHGRPPIPTVPDACELHVDVRLTPSFTEAQAQQIIEEHCL